MNNTFSRLLKNKYVLYLVTAIAIVNVFGYATIGEYRSLLFFILLGTLTTLYSKNMIVVFTVATLGTNLLLAGYSRKRFHIVEGMQNDDDDEAEEEEPKKKKSPFTQRNVPRSIEKRVNSKAENRIGKRVDYASTVEQAYDNLENMLGSSGIKNLTKDTQKLINQQKSLMGTLTEMKPLIGMARETLQSINPNDMKSQLEAAQKMLSGGDSNKKE